MDIRILTSCLVQAEDVDIVVLITIRALVGFLIFLIKQVDDGIVLARYIPAQDLLLERLLVKELALVPNLEQEIICLITSSI